MSRQALSLAGQRFGRLTVIHDKIRVCGIGNKRYCLCDCGRRKWIRSDCLKNGTTRSCGCWKWEFRKLPAGIAAHNELFGSYKRSAQERGLSWRLSRKRFDMLVSDLCYFCHTKPTAVRKNRRGDDKFIYNGIDRLNNNAGYVSDNVVTCCATCNRAKHTMSVRQFRQWIKRLIDANI